MSLQNPTVTEPVLEECLDKMSDFVETLRYPLMTIAVAQSVHLGATLCSLVECGHSTPNEVRRFVKEFAKDVLTQTRADRPASSRTRLIH